MPEGDTIHKGADVMRPLLEGKAIVEARSRWPMLVRDLPGHIVTSVTVRGKHLLLGFDDDSLLRVHLGMEGSWARWEPDEKVPGEWKLGLLLVTDEDAFACYQPRDVERLERRRLAAHPVLSALGPDLAAGPVDLDEVVARARAVLAEDESLTAEDLLLDQRPACGIGNVFKSEILFLGKTNPFVDASTLDDDKLRALYDIGNGLLQAAVHQETRNTTGRRRPDLYVYGRRGEPCLVCGTPVAKRAQDGEARVTSWCPTCQPAGSTR